MTNWIRTYTGKKVNPVHLTPEDICIEDIAHALSNLCRFTGHVRNFYSVAQHSINVSYFCSPKNKLWGLLHDSIEAYINDIASPLKHQEEMRAYREIENNAFRALATAFNLPHEMPEEVKEVDGALVHDEGRYFFSDWETPPEYYSRLYPFSNYHFIDMPPKQAEENFLYNFFTLSERSYYPYESK
jgi:uncharacterized protein